MSRPSGLNAKNIPAMEGRVHYSLGHEWLRFPCGKATAREGSATKKFGRDYFTIDVELGRVASQMKQNIPSYPAMIVSAFLLG